MFTKVLSIPTSKKTDFVDITPLVKDAVLESGVDHGLAHIIVKHTSAALSVQEYEPYLIEDFENFLAEFSEDNLEDPVRGHNKIPLRQELEDIPDDEPQNADAHIKSLFMGNSRVVSVVDGEADFGKYQRALLVELDGPRTREVMVMVQGEVKGDALDTYITDKGRVIDAALLPFLDASEETSVLTASKHILQGGKRLRGGLAILVAEAFGGDGDKALDAAVAVEMMHAASLARDDIQDGDETRRGGLSAWAVFGMRKIMAMTDVAIPHAINMLRKYGREAVFVSLDAWKEVGVGQVKDLFVSSFRTGNFYDEIIMQKTGALFGLAATLGAISSKATKDQKQLAGDYGRALGASFQVMDDMADLKEGKETQSAFKEWLGSSPPEERIDEVVKKVEELADQFPEGEHRQMLHDLPTYAMKKMMAEINSP
jgi:secondary thiamine-phosphate synthase enzyme